MTSRSYCFTAYVEPTPDMITDPVLRYIIFQKELCPKTQRIHWQGYAEFKTPVRIGRSQKICGIGKSHVEKREGTREEARDYCRKTDSRLESPIEIGNWEAGGQGARTDLREIFDMIKNGAEMIDIIEADPMLYCKYRNGIKDYKFECLKSKTNKFRHVETEVHWGEAGTGKTRHCVETYPDAYKLDFDDTLWWDGYEGEETIILNDFYGNIKYHKLLDLLDGYKMRLPVKGGFTYANWTKVLITSNKPPEEWYHHGMTDALKRRLSETRYWGNTKPSTEQRCLEF